MKHLLTISLLLVACTHHPMPTASELNGSHVDSLMKTPDMISYQHIKDSIDIVSHPEIFSKPKWVKKRYYDSVNKVKSAYAARGKRYLDSLNAADSNSIDLTPEITQ